MADMERTIRELNALIETNLDAIEVLNEAMTGLTSSAVQGEVRRMWNDHMEAVTRLQERVRTLGGEPAVDAHASNALKESWQKIWSNGDEKTTLLALRANERVAVDGFKLNLTKEGVAQTMTDEGLREHKKALEMELRHFQTLTNRLREMGAAVDNDEIMGAVRNAAEHLHAAINLSGTAVEAFLKWATGTRG